MVYTEQVVAIERHTKVFQYIMIDSILLLLFSFKEVSFVNWKNHVRKIPYSLWNMFKNCKWGGMGIILDLMT